MQENKLIKILIPVIAVVIIFESIMLVSSLDKQNQATASISTPTQVATQSANVQKSESPVASFVFATTSTEMKVGKAYKVELNLVGKQDFFVDAFETYVKYDPTLVTVSKLINGDNLPKATVSKIDVNNGIIKNAVLIEAKEGYKITKDSANQILTFSVVPKKEGLATLEISTGNDDKQFATMIVETATSKTLPFSSSKLEINVTK